ncbi:MAG: fibronectin type III domain-containing protein [Bacteroidota bacterium]
MTRILLTILCAAGMLYSQWSQTNGPSGGRINSVLVDDDTLYAGTQNGGVYRSSNSGVFWTKISNDLAVSTVYAFASDDLNLYAGTALGVFISSHGSNNWVQANLGISVSVRALVITGTSIIAGTSSGDVFRSTDKGNSWSSVSTDIKSFIIFSFTSNGTDLFAATSGGVFLSTDNGSTWKSRNWGLSSLIVRSLAINNTMLYAATTGGGIFRCAINDTIWAQVNSGLVNLNVLSLALKDTCIFAGTAGGIFRSTNGGTDWTEVTTGLWNVTVNALAVHGSTIVAGTSGGVFQSSNNGAGWHDTNEGLINSFVMSLVNNGGDIFAGTNGGGIYHTTNDGTEWVQKNNGLTNVNVRVLALKGLDIFAGTFGSGIFRSTNNGASWIQKSVGITNLNILSMTVIGSNLYAGTTGGVFRSENNGTNWTEVNTGLLNLTVNALTSIGPKLFAGTGGGVFLSIDNGATWSAVNSGLSNMTVLSFCVNGSDLYAGTNGGIFFSSDYGNSWAERNSGLSSLSVRSIVTDGPDMYAALLGGGIFRSTDNGVQWTDFNNGLTTLSVYTLVMNGAKIFVGTNGLGVFTNTSRTAAHITFTVNLATLPDTISASSFVQIRGNTDALGQWSSASPAIMKNTGGDYWETTVPCKYGDTVFYKFFANVQGDFATNGWECGVRSALRDNDRTLIVGVQDSILPVQYFQVITGMPQNWAPFTETDSIEVFFRINIAAVPEFNKNIHRVGIRCSFSDVPWSTTYFLTQEKDAANAITTYDWTNFYSGVVRLPQSAANSAFSYNFVIHDTDNPYSTPILSEPSFRNIPANMQLRDTTLYWDWFQTSANLDNAQRFYGTGLYEGAPVVSPDGKYIAFYSDTLITTHRDIYLARVTADFLADSVTNIINNSFGTLGDWQPIFRPPDGREIYFLSDRDTYRDLMKYDRSTRTQSVVLRTSPGGGILSYNFSPDGSKFVCQILEAGSHALSIYNADGTNPKVVYNSGTENTRPSWSPDGTKILFASGNTIYTIKIDGTNLTAIYSPTHSLYAARYSPDGKKIAFNANIDGNYDIWMINEDGTELTQITNHTSNDFHPEWDGVNARIYFDANRTGQFDIWSIDVSQYWRMSTGPAPPTHLSAQSLISTQVNISWNASSSGSPEWYRIYRSGTAESGFTKVDSVPSTRTSYVNTGLMPNTSYWYRVTAVKDGYESTPSNEVSVTTPLTNNTALIHTGFSLPHHLVLPQGDTAWVTPNSSRGVWLAPDLDHNGKPELLVTDYSYTGRVHAFESAGNDSVRWIWSSPRLDQSSTFGAGGSSTPRVVRSGDLDGDGRGEIIFPRNGFGILVFEWEGAIGSHNFGSVPSAIITSSLNPNGGLGLKMEQMEVRDIDDDGKQEIIFPSNVSPNEYDDFIILSASGSWNYEAQEEAVFSIEGNTSASNNALMVKAGNPYNINAADLDGDGTNELVAQTWNFGNYFVMKVAGPDSYRSPDTVRTDWMYQQTYPEDAVSLFGGIVADLDKDGNDEVYNNWFGVNEGLEWDGDISILDYSTGDDVQRADATHAKRLTNNFLVRQNGLSIFAVMQPLKADADGNGKDEIITGNYFPSALVGLEYLGGPVSEPSSYVRKVISQGSKYDAAEWEIRDSLGIKIDTIVVWGTSKYAKSTQLTDFDGDGILESIVTSQNASDAIEVRYTHYSGGSIIEDSLRSIDGPNRSVVQSIEFPYMNVSLPSVPRNFKARSATTSQIKLFWQQSLSGYPRAYRIYRSMQQTGTYNLIREVDVSQTMVLDTALVSNTVYWYKITAVNISGESSPSVEQSAKTLNYSGLTSISLASNDSIFSSVVPVRYDLYLVPGDRIDLECYYSTTSGADWKHVENITGNVTGLTADKIDTLYWNCAADLAGTETKVRIQIVPVGNFGRGDSLVTGSFTVDTRSPRFSGIQQASFSGATLGGAVLRWERAEDFLQLIVYSVFIGEAGTGINFNVPYDTTRDTVFTVKHLEQNKQYLFGVRATDAAGNSDTNSVSITAKMPMLSDLNGDATVGAPDLILFRNAWLSNDTLMGDIGPAIGSPPDWQSSRDHIVDFQDVMVLALGWKWSVEHGAIPFLKNSVMDRDTVDPLFQLQETFIINHNEKRSLGMNFSNRKEAAGVDIVFTFDTAKIAVDSITFLYRKHVLVFSQIDPVAGNCSVSLAGVTDSLYKYLETPESMRLWVTAKQKLMDEKITVVSKIFGHRAEELAVSRQQMILSWRPSIPGEFKLSQNYPNPFNPTTTIDYQLPVNANVTIKVYNIVGQEVETVVNLFQKAGYYSARWNASRYASGVYIVRLVSSDFIESRKMILLK